MLTPQMKLECPLCGEGLKFYFFEQNRNEARWAYTHESQRHLEEQHFCLECAAFLPQTVNHDVVDISHPEGNGSCSRPPVAQYPVTESAEIIELVNPNHQQFVSARSSPELDGAYLSSMQREALSAG